MKDVHLVIPELFLPSDLAVQAHRGLHLPALEKLLGRGRSETVQPSPFEDVLCDLFGVPLQDGAPIASLSAAFDGLAAGCWLRADPVHLHLQRNQLLMADAHVDRDEAKTFCESLNKHFAGQGIEFFAPHPQRWYVRLDALPRIHSTPISQVMWGDVRRLLPTGADASRWHQVFNEIQMLLFAHPLNEARETRGDVSVNSVWFWGGGCGVNASAKQHYDIASSDDVLVAMFSKATGVPFLPWSESLGDVESQWRDEGGSCRKLLVWTGLRPAGEKGDLASWRTALQGFENGYAEPLLRALRTGKITQLRLDIISRDSIRHVRLTRPDAWAVWRRVRNLAEYSVV